MGDVCSMNNRRRAELRRLREQTRVRDARVEPLRKPYPAKDYLNTGDGSWWLVWHKYRWIPSQTYAMGGTKFGWLAIAEDVNNFPFYLPMPPAPEEKP